MTYRGAGISMSILKDRFDFWLERWLEKHLGGHVSIKWPLELTVYGHNAMHFSAMVHTRRWGYVCFHPTVKVYGRRWPWYFYVSPNATPWAATFAVGPGVHREEKERAPIRRKLLGHNFDTQVNKPTLWLINDIREDEAWE